MFEGEGCRTTCGGRPRLQLKTVHEGSVRRVRDVLGVGRVYGPYGPYKGQLGSKPIWMWVAEGQDMLEAIELLSPFLTECSRERLGDGRTAAQSSG